MALSLVDVHLHDRVVDSGECRHHPASQESLAKDPNPKLEAQFPRNVHPFCTIRKWKNFKSNHLKLGANCVEHTQCSQSMLEKE